MQRCWQDAANGRSCANARYFVAAAVAPTTSQTVYAGTLNGRRVADDEPRRDVAKRRGHKRPDRSRCARSNDIVVDPLSGSNGVRGVLGIRFGGSGRGHLFRTTNGGATWQGHLRPNLPDVPVNTIPHRSGFIGIARACCTCGTDIACFARSRGRSFNWQPFGTGLPPVVVNRLGTNAATRQLLAATYGRGVWAISSRFNR
jgi:hypothetical protein